MHKQYVKKFGRLGEGGREVQHGGHDAGLRAASARSRSASSRRADRSTLRGKALLPMVVREHANGDGCGCGLPLASDAPRARTSARR